MGLREQAAADLVTILEDTADGFGWPITVTDPDQNSATLSGFSTDVSQTIDPQTGQLVSGRLASVALPIASLTAAGLGLPANVSDGSRNPWVIRFNDTAGTEHVWKVSEAMPDRALGVIVCLLEPYKP